METLEQELKSTITGDVHTDTQTRTVMSRDTSIFTRTPSVVVYPKNADDVSRLVRVVAERKRAGEDISVTARSAGTDMSGGPLTTSVLAVFTKYMNTIGAIIEDATGGSAVTEPGVYYRDFEKETLKHHALILPSYPASRELCAMGGIVNNNSGGERTLEYGKTEKYIEEMQVVLSDGTQATFTALTNEELETKKRLEGLEGDIYRGMSALLTEHAQTIAQAKPKVSKNSAGYALWNVIDEKTGTFNLAKLICGAQGTLALTTKMKLRLVKQQGNRSMLVVFLKDIKVLPEIVKRVLPFNPESFESYDDQTFKLAVKFMPQMLKQMGLVGAIRLGIAFIPEVFMVLRGGVPKLVLMAEFSEDTHEEAVSMAQKASEALLDMHLPMQVLKDEQSAEKYWKVRRESFSLLRKNVHGLYAAPFIDDFVVPPASYPEFLPELNALLAQYKDAFIYTIAGHVGNGNFHIIPLMDLTKKEVRDVIPELSPKVYELVLKYGGSTTGEHNDGIIRTPYLSMMFGEKMTDLFKQTKNIFDPSNIFNPGKKVGGTFEDIKRDMITKV